MALRRQLVRVAAPAAFLLAAGKATRIRENKTRTATTRVQATTALHQPRRPRRTYTVQEGDTLDEIALEHDTTVEELLAANPNVEPTELRPGQRLRLP